MSASIKKFVVAAGLLAAACTFAGDAEIVNVEGRGTGTDKAEALKDAYRDAVERAVGMYVDAEQQIKNEELVEDKILTQSNAYIEKYEVVRERKKANGLFEVQISAEVKKSALTKKLRDVMPKQTFALGDDAQNIHSRVVTTEKRNTDAAALLDNVFGELDPVRQLMNLSLSSSKPIQSADEDGKQELYYRFKFTVDERKYYGEFLPPLLKVLDQIALRKPKDLRLRSVDLLEGYVNAPQIIKKKKDYCDGRWKFVRAKKDGHTEAQISDYMIGCGVYVGDMGFADGGGNSWCFSMNSGVCDHADAYFNEPASGSIAENGEARVMVITKMNASRSVVTAREYALPPECAEVALKWWQKAISVPNVRASKTQYATTTYNIVFSDTDGGEIAAIPISFENRILSNVFLGNLPHYPKGDNYKHLVGLFISPMVHCDAESLEEWIGFDIPQDELPNIKSVTVELAE